MKFQQIYNCFRFRGMSFTLKTCQIVACASMIHQFHEFFEIIFGGFLKFGPAVQRRRARRGVRRAASAYTAVA